MHYRDSLCTSVRNCVEIQRLSRLRIGMQICFRKLAGIYRVLRTVLSNRIPAKWLEHIFPKRVSPEPLCCERPSTCLRVPLRHLCCMIPTCFFLCTCTFATVSSASRVIVFDLPPIDLLLPMPRQMPIIALRPSHSSIHSIISYSSKGVITWQPS